MGRPLRKGLRCLYRPRLMHSESLCHFYTFLSIYTLHLQNFSWRCSCEHFLRYVSFQLFSLVLSQMEPSCLLLQAPRPVPTPSRPIFSWTLASEAWVTARFCRRPRCRWPVASCRIITSGAFAVAFRKGPET